jgi:transposase-like protein
MSRKRKVHAPAFKAQVALAALKGDRTVNELAGQYDVHPTLIHAWKKQLLQGAEALFVNGSKVTPTEDHQAELYEQIGRLKMELEWLKKTTVANLAGPLPACPAGVVTKSGRHSSRRTRSPAGQAGRGPAKYATVEKRPAGLPPGRPAGNAMHASAHGRGDGGSTGGA